MVSVSAAARISDEPFRVRRLGGEIPNLPIYLPTTMGREPWGDGIKHFCVRILKGEGVKGLMQLLEMSSGLGIFWSSRIRDWGYRINPSVRVRSLSRGGYQGFMQHVRIVRPVDLGSDPV